MIRNSISPDDAIALLNEALELDRVGVSQLFLRTASINQALADHPTIQVGAHPDGSYYVRTLGLLNGLFGVADDGYGPIAAEEENGLILRFIRIRIR
jgi:hypothetical protein